MAAAEIKIDTLARIVVNLGGRIISIFVLFPISVRRCPRRRTALLSTIFIIWFMIFRIIACCDVGTPTTTGHEERGSRKQQYRKLPYSFFHKWFPSKNHAPNKSIETNKTLRMGLYFCENFYTLPKSPINYYPVVIPRGLIAKMIKLCPFECCSPRMTGRRIHKCVFFISQAPFPQVSGKCAHF